MMNIKKTMILVTALMMVLCLSFAAAAEVPAKLPEQKDATVKFLKQGGVIEAFDAEMNEMLAEFDEFENLLTAENDPESELGDGEDLLGEEPEELLGDEPEELLGDEPAELPGEEPEEGPAMLTAAAPAVNRTVTITVRCGSTINEGDKITLVSHLEGYEGCKVTYQWQCDSGNGFEDIPGATGSTYTFAADQESIKCSYRVLVDAE